MYVVNLDRFPPLIVRALYLLEGYIRTVYLLYYDLSKFLVNKYICFYIIIYNSNTTTL